MSTPPTLLMGYGTLYPFTCIHTLCHLYPQHDDSIMTVDYCIITPTYVFPNVSAFSALDVLQNVLHRNKEV